MQALVQRWLPRVAGPLIESTVCLYTNTPDQDFILDYHPAHRRAIIASPCSGHGFKFASAVGEILADLVMEQTPRFDLSPVPGGALHAILRGAETVFRRTDVPAPPGVDRREPARGVNDEAMTGGPASSTGPCCVSLTSGMRWNAPGCTTPASPNGARSTLHARTASRHQIRRHFRRQRPGDRECRGHRG